MYTWICQSMNVNSLSLKVLNAKGWWLNILISLHKTQTSPPKDHYPLTFIHQLVRTADESEVVGLGELLGDRRTKEPASSPRWHGPRVNLLWITPHQVTEGTWKQYIPFLAFMIINDKAIHSSIPLTYSKMATMPYNCSPIRGLGHLPLWGISWFRLIVLIWSSVLISGDRPPCTHNISSSMIWGWQDRN